MAGGWSPARTPTLAVADAAPVPARMWAPRRSCTAPRRRTPALRPPVVIARPVAHPATVRHLPVCLAERRAAMAGRTRLIPSARDPPSSPPPPVLLALVAGLLAACGSDDGSGDGTTTTGRRRPSPAR